MDISHGWYMSQFDPPKRRKTVGDEWETPPKKSKPPTMISTHMAGLRTDEDVAEFVKGDKERLALIKFGSSWCHHCREVFPDFLKLTRQFPDIRYAVAQVDYLSKEAQHVEYTPTFTFYKGGKRVDELFGADDKVLDRLKDRMWLHQD